MTFKKIAVPVDFSGFSDKAVEYAMFIAGKFCADITLVHAILLHQEDVDEEEHFQAYEKIIREKEAVRNKRLESKCKVGKERGLQVNSALIRGFSAADSILDYLQDNDFDLIIMGTHGRTGLKKLMLGSVAERVVQLSPVPVLTVHKDTDETDIKKILVPVDFSEYSKIAVKQAIALSREFKASLQFLHVVQLEDHPEFYTVSFDPILEENPDLEMHIAKNLIKLTGISEKEATYVVKEGKVHKEIKTYAEENHVDLIVMATHGMSDLEHFLVGSNSERVVRIAPCPVLTVRKSG